MALNYSAIDALTQRKYIPKLVDNIFRSNPFLNWLKEREETFDGGVRIVEPLIYAELGGIASYSLYDTVSYDTNIPISAAEYTPKNVVAPIIISKDEELRNTGEVQVISLLDSKYKIAERTLQRALTTMLYGDGTGNGSKDLDGLAIACADTGVYGGINRATNAWWRGRVLLNGGTPSTLVFNNMVRLYLSLSDGDDQPDLLVCGAATWAEYHNLVQGRVQVQSKEVQKMASLGYQTLEFFGKPIVADLNCPEGRIYFLNSRYMKWRPHKQANFATTRFRSDDTRIAKKQEILFTGNITVNNCRRFGILTNISFTALV